MPKMKKKQKTVKRTRLITQPIQDLIRRIEDLERVIFKGTATPDQTDPPVGTMAD